MAAFERVKSGIPEMDQILDNIRLGDNVVWRVSDLSEFRLFADPYIEQAKKDHRNIIYIRFASHDPLVEDCPEVKTVHVPLSRQFETFTVEIHNIIEQEGKDAFYVFDCLSELQTAWATDLMMGNFFRVTCPFLFILDTVAFFPIIRGRHSSQAIAKISDTTQLFLDVYSDKENVYVRPEKVWNRYSDTMFLPHIYHPEDGSFKPILDGMLASRFYQVLNDHQRPESDQATDSWDQFFNQSRILHSAGVDISEQCARMCDIMMTHDEKMNEMIRSNFTPEDFFRVRDHMIGTGLIGGKACGMLLARKIIENQDPDLFALLEPHDSFFVGSDVYYSYIVDNDYWDLRIRQRTDEEYFSLADEFADKLLNGTFSSGMQDQFLHILEYYGQDPFIVRSSSILEDGFGNAFAGKYESVFCANRGTMRERLEEFEQAIKIVYASTMHLSALDYRKRRGLNQKDEQMALLVQRVSGSYFGNRYMPCAAGVGYSYSPYRFMKDTDPSAGMLRLVMGLGTSAVDRKEGSYPRLVSLDKPEATIYTTVSAKHQYSQRRMEVIDMNEKALKQITLQDMEESLPNHVKKTMLEHDIEAEWRLRELGRGREVLFISCQGLVAEKDLMENMQKLMRLISEEYDYPVDIEYTINVSEDGAYMINLLQCRPLQVFMDKGKVQMPKELPEEDVFLECKGTSMGLSRSVPIDTLVYVDPIGYYNLPYNNKSDVARVIGKINWEFREQNKHMMLIVPGRIGTSSPELGVPVVFSDISEFDVICEVAESSAGYNPELSYGSHIFQDLVEAEIMYTAIFRNASTLHWDPEKFTSLPNTVSDFTEDEELKNIIGVYDMRSRKCQLLHDLNDERMLCCLNWQDVQE